MSAVVYRNCEVCGLAYEVVEFPGNVAILVEGRVVTDCPQCAAALDPSRGEEAGDGGEE